MLNQRRAAYRSLVSLLLGIVFIYCPLYGEADSESLLGTSQNLTTADVQKQLGLSDTVGFVSDASVPSLDAMPQFILIQDVHKHPEVQAHVAAMLVEGYHHWGVRKVFVEGAFAPIDMDPFQTIPDDTRKQLLGRLVNEGNLSGAELAAVLLNEDDVSGPYSSPFQLIGMEAPDLYRENLEMYREVQEKRPQAMEELASIELLQRRMGLSYDHPLSQQLQRTRLLVQLKLTPEAYKEFLEHKADTPHSPGLDPAVRAAKRFYRLVQQRSWAFLSRATRKLPAWTGPRVVVVGGFHTTVMADYLRKTGQSFVVLTPRVTQAGQDGLYEQKMSETVSALQSFDTAENTLKH